MGMKYGRTICSKHDEIKTRAEKISDLASVQKYVDSFTDKEIDALDQLVDSNPLLRSFLEALVTEADTIYRLADDAKEDGQSMESGLGDKRERIRELEAELELAEVGLELAEAELAQLEGRHE